MVQWLNWRNILAIVAILIVSGTIIYSRYLARKIADDETRKIKTWVEAQKTVMNSNDPLSITLASTISQGNTDIPIIETVVLVHPCRPSSVGYRPGWARS